MTLRPVDGEREVAGVLLRVGHDLGEPGMELPLLSRR
jgi:hypothetical protein